MADTERENWEKAFRSAAWQQFVIDKKTSNTVTTDYLSLVARHLQGGEHRKAVEDIFHSSHGALGHSKLISFRHVVKGKKYSCVTNPYGGSELIVTVPEDIKNEESLRLPVIPVEDFFKTLYTIHEALNHASYTSMWKEVRQRYRGIPRSAVMLFLQGCKQCRKQTKDENKHTAVSGEPATSISQRNGFVQVELKDLRSRTVNGYNFIIEVIDYFTKFRRMLPLKTCSNDEVNNAVRQIIAVQGPPKTLHIPNESQCPEVSDVFKDWPGCPHVQVIRGWPLHLTQLGIVQQENTLVEEWLETEEANWKALGIADPYPWNVTLPLFQYKYNTAFNASVGGAPYDLVFYPRCDSVKVEKTESCGSCDPSASTSKPVVDVGTEGSGPQSSKSSQEIPLPSGSSLSSSVSYSTLSVSYDQAELNMATSNISDCNITPSVSASSSSDSNREQKGNICVVLEEATGTVSVKSPSNKAFVGQVPVRMIPGSKRTAAIALQSLSESPGLKKVSLPKARSPKVEKCLSDLSSQPTREVTKSTIPAKSVLDVSWTENSSTSNSCLGSDTKQVNVGTVVAVNVPAQFMGSASFKLPGIIVQKVGSMHPSYVVRCAYGILDQTQLPENLELYKGDLELTVEGWDTSPTVSLQTAASMMAVYLGQPLQQGTSGQCGCSTACLARQCPCRQADLRCTPACHARGKSGLCKNRKFVLPEEDSPTITEAVHSYTDSPGILHLSQQSDEGQTSAVVEGYIEEGVLYLPEEYVEETDS